MMFHLPMISAASNGVLAHPTASGQLLNCHLRWHPQPDAAPDQAEPHHEVVLLGAVEPRHGLAEEAGVDEKGREARDWVML